MTKLVSLAGAPSNLEILQNIDPTELDDYTAGLIFIKILDDMQNAKMSGWWTDLKNNVKGTASYIGDKTGSSVRLITSPNVISAIGRGVAAWVTKGQSEAGGGSSGVFGQVGGFFSKIKSWLPGSGAKPDNMTDEEFNAAIASIGGDYKTVFSKNYLMPIFIGGVVIVGGIITYKMIKKK